MVVFVVFHELYFHSTGKARAFAVEKATQAKGRLVDLQVVWTVLKENLFSTFDAD